MAKKNSGPKYEKGDIVKMFGHSGPVTVITVVGSGSDTYHYELELHGGQRVQRIAETSISPWK